MVVLGSGYAPVDHIPVTAALNEDGLARIVEAVRISRQLHDARLVVSGGAFPGDTPSAYGYARLAHDLGVDVPPTNVLGTPLDTGQEARAIAALIGRVPFILVTSAYHMPRAMRLMLQAGLEPIPAPTGQRVERPADPGAASADADLLGVAQDRAGPARVRRIPCHERRPAVTRVLVTGASGFVGRALCGELSRAGFRVRAAVRDDRRAPPDVAETTIVGDLHAGTRWQAALSGVELAIHLAGRAHIMNDPGGDDAYMEANARATRNLAAQCAEAGVHRLIFLSSIKVNGEATCGRPFSALDTPRPLDPYGVSKYEGETFALQVAARTGLEVVIVRSPLMYGPGVRANFLRLMRWVDEERCCPRRRRQ